MNNRIKLAKAMEIGITRASDGRIIATESNPDFDPFTDANDDYAVLEWMREHRELFTHNFWHKFNGRAGGLYRIGDYARAALKVLA